MTVLSSQFRSGWKDASTVRKFEITMVLDKYKKEIDALQPDACRMLQDIENVIENWDKSAPSHSR